MVNIPGISDIPGISAMGGAGSYEFSYDALYKKYGGFDLPRAEIELNGQLFSKNKNHMFIHDIRVELTSGFEASIASFRIYNAYSYGDEEEAEDAKYIFDQLKKKAVLGASAKIGLGYGEEVVSVFTGFIASVDFCFSEDEPPYIEVTAMDAKGIMMASAYAAQIAAKSYGDAVRGILKGVYDKTQSGGIVDKVTVTDTPDKKPSGGEGKASAETIEMVSESDYEFVVKAAKKFNYEFFVDRGNMIFRKARSVERPLTSLSASKGVIFYRLGYSLTGMVERIEVRAMDPGTGKTIVSKDKYNEKLSTASKAKSLIKGSRKTYIDPTIFSQEEADARLESLMTQMSYRLGSLDCECIGIPDLIPGRFMDIAVGSPGDNRFYISGIVHEFDRDGRYRTKLTGSVDKVKTEGA
jgi:phage protein D